MPKVAGQTRKPRESIELLVIYGDELQAIRVKLAGNHISPTKRRKLEKRAERLSAELIPRARNTLRVMAADASKKTFQRV
jgi:hypothetical protein